MLMAMRRASGEGMRVILLRIELVKCWGWPDCGPDARTARSPYGRVNGDRQMSDAAQGAQQHIGHRGNRPNQIESNANLDIGETLTH
jgi:hypothetical protein